MKNKRSRLLVWLLVFSMLSSFFAPAALAAEPQAEVVDLESFEEAIEEVTLTEDPAEEAAAEPAEEPSAELSEEPAILPAEEPAADDLPLDDPAATQFGYDGDSLGVIKEDGTSFGMFTPQEGSQVILSQDNSSVEVTLIVKSGNTYKGFYLGALIGDNTTWKTLIEGTEGSTGSYGVYQFTLDKDYCGKATAIAPIKASDETATTSSQYYLAIPSVDKLTPAAEPAADADVFVTISVRGDLALARAAVTVKDENADGVLSYEEALIAAHNKYCPGGYAAGQGSWGYAVSKLWNEETGNLLFYQNDASFYTSVDATPIAANDDLVAAVMADGVHYSDHYAFFGTKALSGTTADTFALELKSGTAGSAAAASGLQTGTWSDGTFTALEGKVTDENGRVELSFAEPGTYVITAKGTIRDDVTVDWNTGATEEMDCPIVAPVCIVTVEQGAAQPETVDLAITNNTGMFKAVTASLETDAEGGETLVMALSGSGYHELFAGTYEDAVANGDNRDNWIHGVLNADGKWEFRIPLTAGVSYYPVVAISQSYLDKYDQGQNPLARAFYPRQFEIDREARTLVTGDYENSVALALTNNVKMFKAESAALKTVGGPNSNGYGTSLELTMGSTSYDKAFVGTAAEAAAAESTIALSEAKVFSIPLRWIVTPGNPDSVVSLLEAPVIISFRSASNGNWYERRFTVDEAGKTLVIDAEAGKIVLSFEIFDAESGTVALLRGPEKVGFFAEQTGKDLAEQLLGAENVKMSGMYMTAFIIDGVEYSPESMDMANGSWLVYKNNANDSVGLGDYKPADGDVYRVVLTTYDPITYAMPVLPNDMNALYWSMADNGGDLTAACQLVQSANPAQADIDAMTASLAVAGGKHYVLIDERTIQVNTTTYPYTYFPTLSADVSSAKAGDTVTVTVAPPEGINLVEGTLKANGVALTAGEDGKYTFTMPDAHVSVTAEFKASDVSKLLSAEFSYDEAGTEPIELKPAFDKDETEYAIDVYDFLVEDADNTVYSKVTFDAAAGTTAKWSYYMSSSGYGFYSDGPAAESGVAYGHRAANILYPGMTNGFKHKIDVTTAGGTVNTYFFQMTMHPTLESLSINGEELAEFEGDGLTYDVTLPAGTESAELLAVPYDPDTYYVYLNDGDDDIAESKTDVALTEGLNTVTITVDDDEGVTTVYTLNITVEEAAPVVPAELQLSELFVFSASNASRVPYALEPAFDPAVGEYTFYLPDSATYAYIGATLAETAEGAITLHYKNPSSGADITKTIVSGNTTGVYANSLGASSSLVGQDVVVKVNDQEAYLLHVVRQATLSTGTNGLSIKNGDTAVTLTPNYNRTVYEYSLLLAKDDVLTVAAKPTVAAATVKINGETVDAGAAVTVTPTWTNRAFDLVIEVGAEGAKSGVYTIHIQEAVASLEITKAPDKLVYAIGDTFDPTGMELKATYADGAEMAVSPADCTITPAGALALSNTEITLSFGGASAVQAISFNTAFQGAGTAEDPFQIATAADMQTLDNYVENGETFAGTYLKVMADIALPAEWNGVGTIGTAGGQTAANTTSKPFGGNFDGGGHTLTIPENGRAVFDFVRGAEIHDLNVYGAKIDDYALVSNYVSDSGVASVVVFDNVTLKSGSQTLYSGFIGGYASGSNLVTIRNCTVEEGVVVGYSRDKDWIGGFAGEFSGVITGSACAADVYGKDFVGGIVADKGQTMGTFRVEGCTFTGSVTATGSYVGGIVGAGYGGTRWGMASGWSCPGVTIKDCVSTGSVTGVKGVGGIFGGEGAQAQAWDNGPTYIQNNRFTGTVSGEQYVGGIIGYMLSLNKNDYISGNYYAYGSGSVGIGAAGGIDTTGRTGASEEDPFGEDNVYYFSSSTADGTTAAEIRDAVPGHELKNVITVATLASAGYKNQFKVDHNRTDDPLGKDAADLCYTDEAPAPVELTITNNTGMFKGQAASLETDAEGNETLVVSLTGSSYHYLFAGTYEEAVANGDNRDNWIAGYQNAEGKWEFRIPLTAEQSYIPLVSISQSYLDKYEQGQNPLARAFYPRQFELDRESKTLTIGDYDHSEALTVSVTGMTKIDAAALRTIGGPNSNGYKTTLEVTMGSTSYNAAFVGSAAEAGAEGAAIIELAEGNVFSIPVRWIVTPGQPDTTVSLLDAPIIVSLRSAKNGTWYERRFVVDETAKTLTVNSPAADAEVFVTISVRGELALARAAVTVKDVDKDGKLTCDEALAAAHEAYKPGGYEVSEGYYGPQISKLWGIETTACMTYVNNAGISTGVTVDTVKAGDELYASVLKDDTGWSDKFTYFDSNALTVTAGKEFTLTLNAQGYDESWNTVVLPVEGAGIGTWADGTFTALDKTTDAEGKAVLSFAEPGTYVVTARGNDSLIISAPVCVVTVEPVMVKTTVSVLGDNLHEEGDESVHTLKEGNLIEWVAPTEIEVPEGSLVIDALDAVFEANGIEYVNKDGNYISSVTFNGVTLTEKDNNPNSGWMFIYNGEHGDKAVNEQVVEAGSVIVFHWTDDYMQEDYGDDDMAVYAVIDMIDALPDPEDLTLDDEEAVKAAREAYDALTDEQKEKVGDIYEKLLADEAKLEELKAAGKVKVTGVSLTLKGQIGIYIYAQMPEGAATAKLTYPKTGEVKTYNLDKNKNYYIESSDQYKFLYENVPAKEMTQPLELEVFDENGSALPITHVRLGDYGTKFTCQAVDYCNTIIENPDQPEKLKDLVKAILNYGQCAQLQFGYDVDNLANPEGYLAEEMKTVQADPANDAEIPANAKDDVGWEYGTLSLKGAVNANLYFSKAITAKDETGKDYTVKAKSGGKWSITVDNIPAKNLGDKFTVAAAYGGKTATIKYCAMSYINAVLAQEDNDNNANLKELCKAMILYNQYAKAYFNK